MQVSKDTDTVHFLCSLFQDWSLLPAASSCDGAVSMMELSVIASVSSLLNNWHCYKTYSLWDYGS